EAAALTFVMVRPARNHSGHRPGRVLLVVGVVAVGPVTARAAGGHPAGPRGRRPLLNHGAPPEGIGPCMTARPGPGGHQPAGRPGGIRERESSREGRSNYRAFGPR